MASYSIIVTILLLCGFLGHTNSQGDVPDTNTNVLNTHNPQTTHASNPDVIPMPGFKAYDVLKQLCDKNGGVGAFNNVERAMYEERVCVQNFIAMGLASEEMERYALTKDLHLVFKNYCPKVPDIKKCVSNYLAAVEPCLYPQEKNSIKIIENVIDAVLSFICFKDGDHIVQYLTAHGPECLESKEQELQQCMIPVLEHYSLPLNPNNGSSTEFSRLPFLAFGAEDCKLATTMQSCVVKKLEECSDPTPAKIADSTYNITLQATPCKKFLTDPSVSNIDNNLNSIQ